MTSKKILVTGAAGFIGYHLCEALINLGHKVIGLDNINNYYDVNLKYARLNELGIQKKAATVFGEISESTLHGTSMQFIRLNIEDRENLPELFKKFNFDMVCNLAAQGGVRYSIENPEAYVDSNVTGFLNVLECCRHYNVKRLVYASSSSVYGNSDFTPFKETANVDIPISLYAATKKSNELMAHTYSHLYMFETIGLRFFTVYGPWGRPDMSPFLFANAIFNETPIKLFNHGKHQRDFTYIDDIVEGIVNVLDSPPVAGSELAPYKIYNIGNNAPIELMDYVATLERNIGKKAVTKMAPLQPGDVVTTYADVDALAQEIGYRPSTTIEQGVAKFIEWY